MTVVENTALQQALNRAREDSKEIDILMKNHFDQQRIQEMISEWNTINIVNFNQKRQMVC